MHNNFNHTRHSNNPNNTYHPNHHKERMDDTYKLPLTDIELLECEWVLGIVQMTQQIKHLGRDDKIKNNELSKLYHSNQNVRKNKILLILV